jgi:glycosyltransferase involved in cell wall biosynthesis
MAVRPAADTLRAAMTSSEPPRHARTLVRRGARSVRVRAARSAGRVARAALRRYVRSQPRGGGDPAGQAAVTFLLGSAWGMGGTIRATLNLAGYLAHRRDVQILSVMRRRDVSFFEVPPGVTVIALDDQRPGATPRRLGLVRDALRRRSSVLMPPETRPFRACSLWTDVRMARALRRRSGVLIGTHPCLNLVAADLSPPALTTIGHEQMHLRAHHASVKRAIARAYPRLDALVVLTEEDAREYARLVPGLPRLAVIPNSVRRLEGGQASLDGTTILAAGRLTPQKGFDLLIRAFARLAGANPEWRLRICGGGPQREDLERLIDEHGLGDIVSLPGRVKRLGEEMARASMFVLSSRFEGFPLILVEAMSKGLPVVSFDCPTGPRDVIDDNRDGILVPREDIDALAGAMRELIADRELRRRLGAEAARTAAGYTIEALGPRWDGLFDGLTGAGIVTRRRRRRAPAAGAGPRAGSSARRPPRRTA